MIRTGQAELYPEIPDELLREGAQDEEHYRILSEFGMRSVIIVPMTTRGRTIGALTFVSGNSGRRFDEQDVELAQELGRRCATAVDNARLYTERSYIARTLQESLLPVELPDIPGVEAAARFRPTGEGNEVGGDFYDMFETGNRGWTVVMGDVCGKGPDAAAVTALARYTLRAAAMRERLPSRSLAVLNEALLRQRDDRRFCTVAYAYIEKLERGARVGVACGGHPLPLLLRADGTRRDRRRARNAAGRGPGSGPRGPRGHARARRRARLLHGRRDREPWRFQVLDERRLAELVATCAGAGADAIAAKVEEAAVLSQGGRPRDDIAVLVLRVRGLDLAEVGPDAARVHWQHGHRNAQGRGEAGSGWAENGSRERSRGGSFGSSRDREAASGPRSTADGDAAAARDRAGHEQRSAHRRGLADAQGGDRQVGGAHRGGRHRPGFDPECVEQAGDDDTGWGLFLVQRLANRWGVKQDGPSKRVWFELRRA